MREIEREQEYRRGGSRKEGPRLWPHPPSARQGYVGEKPASLCPEVCDSLGGNPYRWVEGLCRAGRRRIQAPSHGHKSCCRSGTCTHAVCPHRCILAQTVANRHTSGMNPIPASRLLPRRVHLPFQPAEVKSPGVVLPQAFPAGCCSRTCPQ